MCKYMVIAMCVVCQLCPVPLALGFNAVEALAFAVWHCITWAKAPLAPPLNPPMFIVLLPSIGKVTSPKIFKSSNRYSKSCESANPYEISRSVHVMQRSKPWQAHTCRYIYACMHGHQFAGACRFVAHILLDYIGVTKGGPSRAQAHPAVGCALPMKI